MIRTQDDDAGQEDRVSPPGHPQPPTSEFRCVNCGRSLELTLRSDMCFAEALISCDDCEREYQDRLARGQQPA